MDKLKAYLKSLGDDAARERFAASCETSLGHLRNCIYDPSKRLSPETSVLLERLSGGTVRRWHLRPGDWYLIWPELINAPGAPRVPRTRAVA